MSPPTTRWRGSATTCTRCRPRSTSLPAPSDSGDSFAVLEQRIAALTSTLESRERPAASENSEHLEGALRALSDRIDRMPVGNDSASAFAHLEQRVSYLLERLEASTDHRAGNLGRVEDGLAGHPAPSRKPACRASQRWPRTAATRPRRCAAGRLRPCRYRQARIVRYPLQPDRSRPPHPGFAGSRPQHARPCGRSAGDDRRRSARGALRAGRRRSTAAAAGCSAARSREAARTARRDAAAAKPELPNPAAAEAAFRRRAARIPCRSRRRRPCAAIAPRAISEILEPHAAPPRAAIEPDLPPDHPLEPGTRPTGRVGFALGAHRGFRKRHQRNPGRARASRPARRVSLPPRAAPPRPPRPQPAKPTRLARSRPRHRGRAPATGAKRASTITSKIRSLLVGASVVVIVLGTFKMAMTLLDGGSAPQLPAIGEFERAAAGPIAAPIDAPSRPSGAGDAFDDLADADRPAIVQRPRTGTRRQRRLGGDPADAPRRADVRPATSPARFRSRRRRPPASWRGADPADRTAAGRDRRTGAARRRARRAIRPRPTRSACASPRAKASRANLDEAAKWYDRAAQAGVVPAIFRLGTFYEKGLSVKKDIDIARRYYMQAAERGNAKAMHNLAVLDADGGGKGADYKSAAQWFRKAADRGVADSQFNLGILYARGIGVEQNLAESFKWFSLAAAQGDADSGAQARRYRQAARRPVARRGQARDPDLHAGTAARRRRQRARPRPADGTARRRRPIRRSPRPSRFRSSAPAR